MSEISNAEDEEEMEWTGFDEEPEPVVDQDENTTERSGKPIVMPTGYEVRVMKEATELYQSSSFKLKVRRISSPAKSFLI